MEEYVKEAEEVSFEGGVGESYDKEWALKDQAYRDGKDEGRKEGILTEKQTIAKSMLEKNMDIDLISELTSLNINEIKALTK